MIHSSLHALVDELRTEFKETAKKGKGSFPFYLGFFKKAGEQKVREIWSEVKYQAYKYPALNPKKIFWYRLGQEVKKK